ncbi:hypothetical protein Tco_0635140 [Tanacetum coccineum]
MEIISSFQSGYLYQVKVFDLLLRKETPLALSREGGPAIGLRRVSLSGVWITGRASPYYPVDNRVVVVRSTSSWVAIYRGVARDVDYVPCGTAQLRPCADYAPYGADGLGPFLGPPKFYLNSISNGWLSFSRRGPTPCCLLKIFDSLKNWNDHLSWINASICPIFVPWHTGVSILKDPLPSDNRVNVELLNLLDHHRTVIRRYPETFLCLVRMSRSFDDVHVRPILLKDDESDMGLFDFVKSADSFKVKTGERTLTEGEILLNDKTVNMIVPPSAEIIQIVEHTVVDELKEHAGKKKKRRDSGSTQDGGVRTYHASMGIVVSSSYRPNDGGASPRVEPHAGVGGITVASAEGVGVSGNNAKASTSVPDADSHNDDFFLFSNFVQQHDAEIVALKTKLEKAEHEAAKVVALRGRVSKLEAGVVAKSREVNTLSKHNAKLLGKVFAFESERGDLNRHIIKLGADCESLRNRVAGEAKLRGEFKSFQDEEVRRFEEKSAELDARIADVKRDMDNNLYPHMFIAIAGRRWVLSHGICLAVMKCAQSAECRFALGNVISLAINKGIREGLEAGIEHGKSRRSLAQVEANDPGVKDEFVAVVTDFEKVSFPLLDELESLKDSPLASIMSALVLKDSQGNVDSTPDLQRFQPSLDQVTDPIYSESGSISREMSLSKVVPTARVAVDRRGLHLPSGSTLGGASGSAPPYESTLGVAD